MTKRRAILNLTAALALGSALLAGCSSEGASTDCGLDQCTVTFDVSADAPTASILGVEAKLVSAEGDRVTVEVAGEQLTLSVGQPAAEVAGLSVTLESVTETEAKVRIGRSAS